VEYKDRGNKTMTEKVAAITGITGQTGSYLCEELLNKEYKIYGMIRKTSSFNTERIDHIYGNPNLQLIYGDLSDAMSVVDFITTSKPDLFFNLGGFSHVRASFDLPVVAMDVDGLGVMRCLEAIRKYSPHTRFLQASTSELFGDAPPPQNEQTPFRPRSPYAIGKLAGFTSVVNYREAYNLFASNILSFNHESPRRNPTFASRKISKGLCEIKCGLADKLILGNIKARRDFSHAHDVCRAMLMILEADAPNDFVIASGESHSIEEFLDEVAQRLDLDWRKYVEFDARFLRPTEVPHLLGDPSRAKSILKWEPLISFKQLVDEMVAYDLELCKAKNLLKETNAGKY
jgi:GDPmannose 4,6-dehydratase